MTIVALADTHMVAPGGRYAGNDPWAMLERALGLIDRLEPDLVIHAGDIVAAPARRPVYRAFFDRLAVRGHAAPWHLIPGNHDDKVLLSQFADRIPAQAGIHVHTMPTRLALPGYAPLVMLPDRAGAAAVSASLEHEDWSIAVTHRHLTPTGAHWIDATIHPQRQALLQSISQRGNRMVINGHTHRWATNTYPADTQPLILTLDGLATTFDHAASAWALAAHRPSVALIECSDSGDNGVPRVQRLAC